MPDQKRQVYAIFSGGGVKAAAFVGAVQEANCHVEFKGVGGTSAGALVATLIACGYSGDELERVLFEAPYPDFFRRHWVRFLMNQRRGLFEPASLLRWLRIKIADKKKGNGKITFRDLGGPILKIIATNVSTQQIVIYSSAETPNQEVAQAVLASSSFPVLFPSVRHGDNDIVDGGLMTNFPMWLFDDERQQVGKEQVGTIGFMLHQRRDSDGRSSSFPSHLYDVFEAVLVAQDRVQEKYLDVERLADVIRITIPATPTFDAGKSLQKRDQLIDAGRLAAKEYFEKTSETEVRLPSPLDLKLQAARCLEGGQLAEALSFIARDHILDGGVAKDAGLSGERRMVRYYVDLMGAVTDSEKLDMLASVLAARIRKLAVPFDRVIGLKKGNLLLAAKVGEKLAKPFTVLKSDMSYKMGAPFDGDLVQGERVLIVDDIASDASMLLRAVNQIRIYKASVSHAVTLVDRPEGDARDLLGQKGCALESVCRAGDEDIKNLLYKHKPLPLCT